MSDTRRPGSLFRRLASDRRGSIALKFALGVPGVAMLSLGAIDLYSVQSADSRLQDIADAAALAGAAELGLAVNAAGPAERARAYVAGNIREWRQAPDVETRVDVVETAGQPRAIRVTLDGARTSFFGNLLPPGGWKFRAEAVASPVGLAPLCVLTHGERLADVFVTSDSAAIEAPLCLIHSNDKIVAAGSSRITAATVQSVGRSTGRIQRAPQQGAPAIRDPYRDLKPVVPGRCGTPKVIAVTTSMSLSPGLHCDDYVVSKTAELRLLPGEHYFSRSRLELRETARLTGDDVVLIFDRAAFDFLDDSRVDLTGRRSGQYAGFALIGLRPPTGGWCAIGGGGDDDDDDDDDDDEDDGLIRPVVGSAIGVINTLTRPRDCRLGSEFRMASDNIERLDGVIYFPAAKLTVQGTNRIAEQSDWTVMVVQSLVVKGSPILVINADYGGSVVPVPVGVGPRKGGARLID